VGSLRELTPEDQFRDLLAGRMTPGEVADFLRDEAPWALPFVEYRRVGVGMAEMISVRVTSRTVLENWLRSNRPALLPAFEVVDALDRLEGMG
jgi:hypothetical protein